MGFVLCYRKEQQKRDFQTDQKKGGKKSPTSVGLQPKDSKSVMQPWQMA